MRSPTLALVDQPWTDLPPPARRGLADSGPIFTDLSGQRRRLMRLLGAAGSIFLLGALILAGLGLFGGPPSQQGNSGAGGQPGRSGQGAPGGSPGSRTPSPAPRPSGSGSASPSAQPTSVSASPAPTNRAGKTPPGQTNSPSPRPHPSPSSHGP